MLTRNVLIIAYEFPPFLDSGAHRPAAFAKYLPEFGYRPVVLTRREANGRSVDLTQLQQLPECVHVQRVESDHPERWEAHVSSRLRSLRPLERLLRKPPGWIGEAIAWRLYRHWPELHLKHTWTKPAIRTGRKLIQRFSPDVILSTAPPLECLEIGRALSASTGIPHVVDFRDPLTYSLMWDVISPRARARTLREEPKAVRQAAAAVVVTPIMHRRMVETYPDLATKVVTITNGFDGDLEGESGRASNDEFLITYVGTLSSQRWPAVFFSALQLLKEKSPHIASHVRARFVGPCHFEPATLRNAVNDAGIGDMVEFAGPVSVETSRLEMRRANVLLLFEPVAAYAIPGKLFEYFAAQRPVLGMVLPGGDAEQLVNESNMGIAVGIDEPAVIARAIAAYWDDWRRGANSICVNRDWLEQFHRRNTTARLADLMNTIIGGAGRSASLPETRECAMAS